MAFWTSLLAPGSDLITQSNKQKGDLYGKKPVYKTPQEAAAEALAANQANLPAAEQLAGNVNAFNQEQLLASLRKAIPNFDELIGKQSDVLKSQLAGEIPQSVSNQLQLSSASRAQASGYSGSEVSRNLTARDLGLTSLDITNKALASTDAWLANTARLTQPAMFNVSSAFISPEQQQSFNKLQSENFAAPKPDVRGAFDTKMSMFGTLLGAYGGPGYQNAYHPSYQQPSAPSPNYYMPTNWGGGTGIGASEGGGNIGNYNTVGSAPLISSPGFGSGGPYE